MNEVRKTVIAMLTELKNSSLVDDLKVYRKALRKQSNFVREDTCHLTLDTLITLLSEERERVVEKEVVVPVLRYFQGQPIDEQEDDTTSIECERDSPRGEVPRTQVPRTQVPEKETPCSLSQPFIDVFRGIIRKYNPASNIHQYNIQVDGSNVRVSGPTRCLKEGLRQIGGKFDHQTQSWVFEGILNLLNPNLLNHDLNYEEKHNLNEDEVVCTVEPREPTEILPSEPTIVENPVERPTVERPTVERLVETKPTEVKIKSSSESTPRSLCSEVDLGHVKPKKIARKILKDLLGRDVSNGLKLTLNRENKTIEISQKNAENPVRVRPSQVVNFNLAITEAVSMMPVWSFEICDY